MSTLLLAGALSLLFTLLMTPVFIRIFRRVGWGQFISDGGPDAHHAKKGTPTMGGIVVVVGVVIAYFLASLLTGSTIELPAILVLFLMTGLGLVGFIDDFIKTHKQRSLGLSGWPKVFGQVIVAVIFGLLAINFPDENGITPASMSISFIRNTHFNFAVLGGWHNEQKGGRGRVRTRLAPVGRLLLVPEHARTVLGHALLRGLRPDGAALEDVSRRRAVVEGAHEYLLQTRRDFLF